jgi:hypothetical protein
MLVQVVYGRRQPPGKPRLATFANAQGFGALKFMGLRHESKFANAQSFPGGMQVYVPGEALLTEFANAQTFGALKLQENRALTTFANAQTFGALTVEASVGDPWSPATMTAPPTVAGATWTQIGSPTFEDFSSPVAGVRLRQAGENGNTNRFRGAFQARPGSAYDLVARFRTANIPGQWNSFGLALRESSTGKIVQWSRSFDAGGFGWVTWTNETSFGSSHLLMGISGGNDAAMPFDWWMKVHDDLSANLTLYVSKDGNYWVDCGTISYSSAFTTAPNEVGIGLNSNYFNTTEQMLECASFKAA